MRAVALACFVLVASPAWSQTVVLVVPISDIVPGGVSAEPIEIDGDATTQEWLVEFDDGAHRIAAQRSGSVCWGRLIHSIGSDQRRSIGVYNGQPVLTLSASTSAEQGRVSVVVALETPVCGDITPPRSE